MKDIEITLDDLVGEQKELAEVIGLDAYLRLIEIYGGTTIYIAKLDNIKIMQRNKKIISEYTGYNAKFLANKYGLSDRALRTIIANYVHSPLPGQLSFFDDS